MPSPKLWKKSPIKLFCFDFFYMIRDNRFIERNVSLPLNISSWQ